MSPELQPIAVQYYCHVSQSVSSDQYTALPLEGILVPKYGRISYIYISFGIILHSFMSISRDKTEFSGSSLYLLSFFLYFFLYSPFNFKSLHIGYLDQEFKIYDIPNRPHTFRDTTSKL